MLFNEKNKLSKNKIKDSYFIFLIDYINLIIKQNLHNLYISNILLKYTI